MITVVCVLVRGHVDFTPLYVRHLRSMVTRHLRRPHRFVCLADQECPPGIEVIQVRRPDRCLAWWTKVNLFNPALGLEGRCLYLDLDTLPVAALDVVVDYPAPLALAPDGAPNFVVPRSARVGRTGNYVVGTGLVKRFNSSVMVWDAGYASELYREWTPEVAARLWGDQDWAGERFPDAAAMPAEWFPRISEIGDGGRVPPAARVLLVKKPKNTEAARRWPWFRELWG